MRTGACRRDEMYAQIKNNRLYYFAIRILFDLSNGALGEHAMTELERISYQLAGMLLSEMTKAEKNIFNILRVAGYMKLVEDVACLS